MNNQINEIRRILDFYAVLERPLTLTEIQRLVPFTISLGCLFEILEMLVKDGGISVSQGFYTISKKDVSITKRKWQDFLLDEKWRKLDHLRHFFSFVPFVHFVFISGSLALQNVKETSDFDVLVGCKTGRIFTVRFLSMALFGLLGIRRKRLDHKNLANNKICLNHFVTPESYKLAPPYSLYWEELYMALIPFIGDEKEIGRFWKANRELVHKNINYSHRRFREKQKNAFRSIFEFIFDGRIGGALELFLKNIQIRRVEKHLRDKATGFGPRLVYTNSELEFHPDTKRIDEILKKMTP